MNFWLRLLLAYALVIIMIGVFAGTVFLLVSLPSPIGGILAGFIAISIMAISVALEVDV